MALPHLSIEEEAFELIGQLHVEEEDEQRDYHHQDTCRGEGRRKGGKQSWVLIGLLSCLTHVTDECTLPAPFHLFGSTVQ